MTVMSDENAFAVDTDTRSVPSHARCDMDFACFRYCQRSVDHSVIMDFVSDSCMHAVKIG